MSRMHRILFNASAILTLASCAGAPGTESEDYNVGREASDPGEITGSVEEALIAAWAPNTSYTVGTQVTYGGSTYQCIQSHTSLTGWEPPNTPALWGLVAGGGDTQAPTVPGNLSASGITSTSVSLSWSASTDNVGVTGYSVYRSGTLAASPSGTSATVTGLSPSTTYGFTVRARDAAGNLSGSSSTLNVTTAADSGGTGGTGGGGTSGKRVIGYFAEWGVYGRNYHVKNIDTSGSASKLTHINYAFGNVTNSRCQLGDTYADYDRFYSAADSVDGVADTWDTGALRGSFNQLKKLKAKYPNLKVLISLGGWSWSSGFSDAALPANRPAFVQSCVDLFIKDTRWANLFDGIDIDWEYPGACGNTCNYRLEDTQNFTALLAEFRTRLNAVRPGLLLTIAAPAGPDKVDKIQVGSIHPSLDFINLMTYDMHGAWEATTNAHSPLYNSPSNPAKALKYSTAEAVSKWLAGGTPASKLVVGVPFYGRGWTGVTNANNGMWQPAAGAAQGTYEAGIEDYKVLKAKGHPGFTHPDTKAFYTFNGTEFWSYDNPSSMATKMAYIKSNSLGGAMFWELSGDTSGGELITAIANGLQ